jgi:hypothetical protein
VPTIKPASRSRQQAGKRGRRTPSNSKTLFAEHQPKGPSSRKSVFKCIQEQGDAETCRPPAYKKVSEADDKQDASNWKTSWSRQAQTEGQHSQQITPTRRPKRSKEDEKRPLKVTDTKAGKAFVSVSYKKTREGD